MVLKNSSKTPQNICLQTHNNISFDNKSNTNIFKTFFGNLAKDLVKKLPRPKNVFGIKSVEA